MHISAIVAMSENAVIGKENKLPWHLPADLAHFKKLTMGKPILMGRKTFESIGRVLPGRCNVIISRDENFNAPGCVVASSIDTALASVSYADEVFVIGGAALLQQMLPVVERLYLTIIHHEFEGDVFFPDIDLLEWNAIDRKDHEPDEANPYSYSFITLERMFLDES
jgi:dihydrofolate reductase